MSGNLNNFLLYKTQKIRNPIIDSNNKSDFNAVSQPVKNLSNINKNNISSSSGSSLLK